MRRMMLMVMVMVAAFGCSNCTGPDVTDSGPVPPPAEVVTPPPPVEVDAGAVAAGTVTALLEAYAHVAGDDTLTAGEAVDVAFAAAEGGIKSAGVWDKPVKGSTIGGRFEFAKGLVVTAMSAAGVRDYILLDPSTPHMDLGNALALVVADYIPDAFEDKSVTVGELYVLPIEVTTEALILAGKWDEELGQTYPDGSPVTIGSLFHGATTLGEQALRMAGVWDYVAFVVPNPGEAYRTFDRMVPEYEAPTCRGPAENHRVAVGGW